MDPVSSTNRTPCEELEERLPDLVEASDLAASERERLLAHAETCSACAESLRSYRALLESLRALPPCRAPADLAARVLRSIESVEATAEATQVPQPRARAARWRMPPPALRAAAALVVLSLGGFLLLAVLRERAAAPRLADLAGSPGKSPEQSPAPEALEAFREVEVAQAGEAGAGQRGNAFDDGGGAVLPPVEVLGCTLDRGPEPVLSLHVRARSQDDAESVVRLARSWAEPAGQPLSDETDITARTRLVSFSLPLVQLSRLEESLEQVVPGGLEPHLRRKLEDRDLAGTRAAGQAGSRADLYSIPLKEAGDEAQALEEKLALRPAPDAPTPASREALSQRLGVGADNLTKGGDAEASALAVSPAPSERGSSEKGAGRARSTEARAAAEAASAVRAESSAPRAAAQAAASAASHQPPAASHQPLPASRQPPAASLTKPPAAEPAGSRSLAEVRDSPATAAGKRRTLDGEQEEDKALRYSREEGRYFKQGVSDGKARGAAPVDPTGAVQERKLAAPGPVPPPGTSPAPPPARRQAPAGEAAQAPRDTMLSKQVREEANETLDLLLKLEEEAAARDLPGVLRVRILVELP